MSESAGVGTIGNSAMIMPTGTQYLSKVIETFKAGEPWDKVNGEFVKTGVPRPQLDHISTPSS